MARNGFRCMITGALDWISREQNAELQNERWLLENMPVNVAMTPILGGLATQEVGEENTGVRTIAVESPVTTLTLYPDGSYRHGDPEAVRTGCGWYLRSSERALPTIRSSLQLWHLGTMVQRYQRGAAPRDPSLLLTKHTYSLTVTRSTLPIRAWNILFAQARLIPKRAQTRPVPKRPNSAPQSWSTFLRTARACHPLIPSCLRFMRHVLRLRSRPALPRSPTD